MVQTIHAPNINLLDLEQKFGLKRTDDEDFFREWQDYLPDLTDLEREAVNEVKANYLHLSKSPVLEPIVKMVVLSPLLRLAGLYRPPFYITAGNEVRISSVEEGSVVQVRIEILVFQPDFWVTLIGAKKAQFSLYTAIPQALAHMLNNPHPEKPALGFVTNGAEFRFLKLSNKGMPKYAQSHLFSLDSGNDLDRVLSVLKRFAHLLSR